MEQMYKRLGNLLTIKSMVTLICTAVFAWLTCSGGVSAVSIFYRVHRSHCVLFWDADGEECQQNQCSLTKRPYFDE